MGEPSFSELVMAVEEGDARAAFIVCEDTRPDSLRDLAALCCPSGVLNRATFDALADGWAWWLGLLAINALLAVEPRRAFVA